MLSVADPGRLSRIPDPTTAPKEEGKKCFVLPFFVATNVTFNQKFVIKLSKLWVWDQGSEARDQGSEARYPGSGKNLFRIPDIGAKRHRIQIRKTAYTLLCRTISWAGCGTATRLSRQRTGISGFSSGSARAETSGEVLQVGPNQEVSKRCRLS
jgi:hypothetical protein